MKRSRTNGEKEGWRRWLLALTLCLFAFAYGAPTSLAAHAAMPHATMGGDCPGASSHKTGADKAVGLGTGSACCIAHCLPAVPIPNPTGAIGPVEGALESPAPDEIGEGRAVPVLLPPPRG